CRRGVRCMSGRETISICCSILVLVFCCTEWLIFLCTIFLSIEGEKVCPRPQIPIVGHSAGHTSNITAISGKKTVNVLDFFSFHSNILKCTLTLEKNDGLYLFRNIVLYGHHMFHCLIR